MVAEALIARAGSVPELLLATDYDGTISEIAVAPAEACPIPGALEALEAIAATRGATVAVISGRTSVSLRAQTTRLDHVFRGSEHGAFLEPPGGPIAALGRSVSREIMDALEAVALDVAARVSGIRVERKQTGVSIHHRAVLERDRPAADRALASFRADVERLGLAFLDGRQVVEARSAENTKATALAVLLARCKEGVLVIYAGDDRTDDDAILLAHDRGGVGVFVASPERPDPPPGADIVLATPNAWCDVLAAIAARRAT